MPTGHYIPEEQVADWTSLGIRDFFARAGYSIVTYRPTQHLERDMPADRVFLDVDSGKLFGLQYKALYHNGENFWPITAAQHETLQSFPWIYYGFSELMDPAEHGIALERIRIARQRFRHDGKLLQRNRRSPRPLSWPQFFDGLKKCTHGRKLWKPTRFESFINLIDGVARRRQARLMYDLFLLEVDRKILVVPPMLPSGQALQR